MYWSAFSFTNLLGKDYIVGGSESESCSSQSVSSSYPEPAIIKEIWEREKKPKIKEQENFLYAQVKSEKKQRK